MFRHVTDIAAFHELKVFAKKFFLLHYLPSSFRCGQKDTTKMASFHQRLFLQSISKIWVQHDYSQCCFWTKNSEKLYTNNQKIAVFELLFAHSAFWQGCQLSQPFCSRALKQIADIFCFFLSQPLLIILDPALPSPSFFRSFLYGTTRILYSLQYIDPLYQDLIICYL